MFIGHFGIGFGAKKVAPRVSLGTLFLAAQFIDLLWPPLLLFGIERVSIAPGNTQFTPLDFESYPISHSLAMVALWAVLFGLIYWLGMRYRRGAIVLGACVVSHWLLDLIVHRPDLPLIPGSSTRVGLGLWNSVGGTLIAESAIFIAGFMLYLRVTSAKDRIGLWGLWALVGFLVLSYIGNIFGPPPPDVRAIGWIGNAQWLLVLWAYWVDRHRTTAVIGH